MQATLRLLRQYLVGSHCRTQLLVTQNQLGEGLVAEAEAAAKELGDTKEEGEVQAAQLLHLRGWWLQSIFLKAVDNI